MLYNRLKLCGKRHSTRDFLAHRKVSYDWVKWTRNLGQVFKWDTV